MVLLPARPAPVAAQGRETGTVVLHDVTVIDVRSGARVPGSVIVVTDGRIVRVDRLGAVGSRRPPAGARVISARGKFAIPGLWDMHVEQALPLWDRHPLDSNATLFHPLFLAHGVTGVRDVAGPLTLLRRWQREIESGARVGPRMVFTGPKFSAYTNAATRQVTGVEALAGAVSAHVSDGAHAIYISDLPGALHDPLVRLARQRGLGVEGNVPLEIPLRAAADAGQRVVDHMDGFLLGASSDERAVRRRLLWNEKPPWWLRAAYRAKLAEPIRNPGVFTLDTWSDARARDLARHLAQRRMYQVPTLRLLGTLLRARDSLVRLPPSPMTLRPPRHPWQGWAGEPVASGHPLAREWERRLWVVGEMQRAGVPLLAGSDAPNLYAAPGSGLHDELGLLVRAGLTPHQALRAATLTPAEYLGATDSLGTVDVGRVADLVLLDADPLLDIANTRRIAAVMVRGRWLDRSALDSLAATGRARAAEVERYWLARQAEER